MIPSTDNECVVVLTLLLKVTLDNTTDMSSVAASHRKVDAEPFELTKLRPEIRSQIFGMSAPKHIDLAAFEFPPGKDPTFVSGITQQQHNRQLRLEDIEALLQKTVLEITTKVALVNALNWLVSVDFLPLKGDKQTSGLDEVLALGFSDANRVKTHRYTADEFANDGTRDTTVHLRQTDVAPSSWADDLELTRRCKRLRTVEMKVALPSYFLERLRGGQTMEQVVQGHTADLDELLPIHRLLKLEGLKELRPTFFTHLWQATMLNVEQERVIICWLQEEFKKRGQSVKVVSEFGWWE
jgi:hypothetical protein